MLSFRRAVYFPLCSRGWVFPFSGLFRLHKPLSYVVRPHHNPFAVKDGGIAASSQRARNERCEHVIAIGRLSATPICLLLYPNATGDSGCGSYYLSVFEILRYAAKLLKICCVFRRAMFACVPYEPDSTLGEGGGRTLSIVHFVRFPLTLFTI